MLIDVHAHFYHDRSPRADWRERNASRLAAGEQIGITIHVASILGSWGRASPTYSPSPADLPYGNAAMLAIAREHPNRVRGYVTVNPNYPTHALGGIVRCLGAGMIGIKLAASRRATDPLLDPICEIARERGVPVLQHVWQHRRRDWPGQEASDGAELCALAGRHPKVRFILGHIGGGGGRQHTRAAPRAAPHGFVDLSGGGGGGGVLEGCVAAVGVGGRRWGGDITPVPAVHPGLPGWEAVLAEARARGAPVVRCDPTYCGLDPAGAEMRGLAAACGAAGLPLLLAVRLEDARQRHPNDRAAEVPAAAVRALVRSDADVRLVVTHADRAFVEEVHFGSTPEEAARIWWDICWIWGPPEDHLKTLLHTVGVERFVFGTGQPLRIPENSVSKLDLLELAPQQRAAIESENARRGLLH